MNESKFNKYHGRRLMTCSNFLDSAQEALDRECVCSYNNNDGRLHGKGLSLFAAIYVISHKQIRIPCALRTRVNKEFSTLLPMREALD